MAVQLRRLLAWVCLYSILAGGLQVFFGILATVYIIYPSAQMSQVLLLLSIIVPILLIVIGVMSLGLTSEYAYTRGAALNPVIAREAVQHQKRGPDRRKGYGILLGIVGATTPFGISPWSVLLLLKLDIPMMTIL